MTDDRWRMSRPAHGPGAHAPDTVRDEHDEWVVAMLDGLDDEQMDALLDGTYAVEGLEPVLQVVRRLRASAAAEPVPRMSPALRAMLAGPAVVALPARSVARGAFLRAAVAAAVAAVALLGAGAAQNRLPTGIQDVVSSTAELVGVDLPRAEDRDAGDPGADHRDSDGSSVEPQHPDKPDESNGADGPSHGGSIPGDADRADPGAPGDHEPATPPDASNGGGANDKPRPEKVPSINDDNANGAANGNGVAGGNGNGSTSSNPAGQANGTGNAKK